MQIITVTLNPAFDVHCTTERFLPYRENIFDVSARDAGGKGVNVSRALLSNGVESLAVCAVGRENGAEFLQALRSEGLTVAAVAVEGRIRENITLHEKDNPETRISFSGFSMNEAALAEVKAAMGELREGSVCVLAGSAPKGISEQSLVSFLEEIKAAGARLVIDSRSLCAASVAGLRPMLIKPNKDEAEQALGVKIESREEAVAAAEALRERGSESVLLSLGGEGAILACSSGVYFAAAPRVEVLSTVGAGDSSLAGYLSAAAEGLGNGERLRRAVAFGSSACLLRGTAAPRPSDIAHLLEKTAVEKIR